MSLPSILTIQFSYKIYKRFRKKQIALYEIKLKIIVSICYTNYDILCSKCPPLADTRACGRLRESFTALLMAFSLRQTKSAAVRLKIRELFLALVTACDNTPALHPNVIIQRVG